MFFAQCILHLSGQPGKNIIVRHRIVVTMLLLIHERNVGGCQLDTGTR